MSFIGFLAILGLLERRPFQGNRIVASDCNDIFLSIIKADIPSDLRKEASDLELEHFRFKNSIWNKILSTKDFENFNELEYFRLLEIYKDDSGIQRDLLSMNPVKIEQKLAVIEAIQQRFSSFANLPSMREEIQNLNAYKLKKLQRLMKNFDLNSKISRENLESFSSDFFLILKGPPISLLDYFTKNKTLRMNEAMMRTLQEDMLIRGLKGVIERIPEKNNLTHKDLARLYVKRIMKYKIWRFLVVPYDLPWIDRVKISDDLLEKIFIDGLDTHESELIIELKRQNRIDHYERFRKVYRPVAFGVGFYYYYQKYQTQLKQNEATDDAEEVELKKKFMEEFKTLAESIHTLSPEEKTENELKEIQFERVLKQFRIQYKEEPTPKEYQELREKIFGN